ncbi:peptide ABC transporter permease [Candidatus Marinamargulisbacteria bacterium SCGC AG-439-L15]|nr:peptide ABC transporter permease [Candidatus Marinamargulisbacteria bacterium SCGC AG-439-L15]
MGLVKLTLKSILSRQLISILLVVSIGISTMLLLGVQKIKHSAKLSFSHSISGTDLIVGARSGDVQLLLYTVFRQGQPIANMSWKSVEDIRALSETEWVVPLSLGDSHKGFPVLGTNLEYFKHYQYGRKRALSLQEGRLFSGPLEVVLGHKVMKTVGYNLNDTLYLSHGIAKKGTSLHKNRVFRVVGILEPTGTPVDNTVHVSLEGITALHLNWRGKTKERSLSMSQKALDLTPTSVTGCLVGLNSKFSIFSIKNRISSWEREPLMAIIPGVTLSQLWRTFSVVDTLFLVVTILVIVIAFIGLLLALFMSLQQRSRELAILRTMGAHPLQLSMMLILESLIVTVGGVLFGLSLLLGLGTFLKPLIESKTGLILSQASSMTEVYLVLGLISFGVLTSLIPAYIAHKKGLSEGFVSL